MIDIINKSAHPFILWTIVLLTVTYLMFYALMFFTFWTIEQGEKNDKNEYF